MSEVPSTRTERRLENERLFPQGKRRCSACAEIKSLDSFYPHRAGSPDFKLGTTCKACSLKQSQAYGLKRRQSELALHRRRNRELKALGLRRCTKCKSEKPVSEFYTFKRGKPDERLSSQCVACIQIESKARWQREVAQRVPRDDDHRRVLANRRLAKSGQKECRGCSKVLSITDFYKIGQSRTPECRSCFKRLSPERTRAAKYGLSLRAYKRLSDRQGGVCAICHTVGSWGRQKIDPRMPLVVDHDHKTGEVRGLLCASCNSSLGFLNDDVGLLAKAAKYLRNPPARKVLSATESDNQPR